MYQVVKKLSLYIIGVYLRLHLNIKYKSNITDGPAHLFNEIALQKKYLSGSDLKIVQDSVQNNCWFANPECILVSMLASGNGSYREKAVEIIKNARCSKDTSKSKRKKKKQKAIRRFVKPKVQFDASDYNELCKTRKKDGVYKFIDSKGTWTPVTEPPLTIGLNTTELEAFREIPLTTTYLCHTQPVERNVKLTSEATSTISGRLRQIGEALSTVLQPG